MLAHILRVHGHAVVHNRAGANTHWGIATALADAEGDLAVLEVDEAWLPLLASQLKARVLVLGNLFRDRLDGYGELRRLTELWRSLLTGPNCPTPVGANVILQLLRAQDRPASLHLWLALNDGVADGRDVSWIWDADFEQLAPLVSAVTCSGRRAAELALRLKYAGWQSPIEVDRDLARSFRSALSCAPDRLIALPNYTALLGLRPVLNDHGVSVTDWGTSARLGRLAPVRAL